MKVTGLFSDFKEPDTASIPPVLQMPTTI
jgi:hypothetical protein